MGDLAEGLINLSNPYLSIRNVTKAYGFIQIMYMVNIVTSHFANNFSTKGGLIYKVHHHFPNPTRTFFFSPKAKSVKMVHHQYVMISPLYHMENIYLQTLLSVK